MGDHRSHSGDSKDQYVRTRNVQAATIPVNAVVGRAFVVFWPVSRAKWLSPPEEFASVPDPPNR
jgi:signal peptidase I